MNLPPDPTPEREQAIRELVRNGKADVLWAPITSSHDGHTAEFYVFADALKIDGVRVNVTAETEQVIADTLDCMLLTPKLSDLIWLQRQVTLPPFPRGNLVGMSSTEAMVEHSRKIDVALQAIGNPTGLICTVGKHWVIDNQLPTHPGMAENYGWYFDKTLAGIPAEAAVTPGIAMIQGRGWRHNKLHVDYSQICVLVSNQCTLDGKTVRLPDVLRDPVLAFLANHDGILRVLRQPGVPPPEQTDERPTD